MRWLALPVLALIAFSPLAAAEIVHVAFNPAVAIPFFGGLALDLDANGSNELFLGSSSLPGAGDFFTASASAASLILQHDPEDSFVRAVLPGILIGQGSGPFGIEWNLAHNPGLSGGEGDWNNNDFNDLGMRFVGADGLAHYAWVSIDVTYSYEIILSEYAYETTPETAIPAGAVPAPSSLSLLALGGLLGARRRRS